MIKAAILSSCSILCDIISNKMYEPVKRRREATENLSHTQNLSIITYQGIELRNFSAQSNIGG